MDLDNVYVADIETIGFLDKLNSFDDFHVLGVGYKDKEGQWKVITTNKKEDVQKFFGDPKKTIVIHNGIRYDKPALEKMGIEVKVRIIDSLALSWNLLPNRGREGKKYGLEFFGEDFGIPKPKIDDWENLTYEDYQHRVAEDVKINIMLWELLYDKGKRLYEGMEDNFHRLVNLLDFIMLCAHKQEMQGLHVDFEKTQETINNFQKQKDEQDNIVKQAMPKVPIKTTKNKPKVMFKKDGSYSKNGIEWLSLLERAKLPLDYEGEIELIKGYEDANPNSVSQKKQWLYSLGWKPQTWKHNRDKITNEVTKVEQIFTEDKTLCPSVLKLAEKEPAIRALEGGSILNHRLGVLNSFISNSDENGMITQGLISLALSMRWQHSRLVNMPRYTGKGDIRDGKWIRECLIPPPGYKIVQADLSGIESRTSDHYTFNINKERIEKTKKPYFDPHTEIAVFAGLMTPEEETFYIYKSNNVQEDIKTFSDIYLYNEKVQELLDLPEEKQKKLLQKLKNARSSGKTTNYSSLYKVGSSTLARTLGITKSEAQKLIDSYWEIHYAVKEFTETVYTKEIDGETWAFNPISRLFYNIRNEKDIFSTINQSSAVYCFNMWIYFIVKRGEFPATQTHDDAVLLAKEGDENRVRQVFHDAMDDLNNYLKLNVKLDCESQIGVNLAETH